MTRKIVCGAILLAVVFLTGRPLFASPKYALVIGNGNYTEIAPLRNPENDAVDMADKLKSLGFETEVLLNSDLRRMRDAVRRLASRLSVAEEATGIFYYAGHGIQADGENYLIPVNGDIKSELDLRYESLPVRYVIDYLNESGAVFNMIILDACRDNPISTFRSVGRGLAMVEAPKGSIVMYATGAGEVAEDGTGRNGTFTDALLRHIGTSGVDVHEMVRLVMRDVSRETDGRQVPAFYSNFFGDFSFASGTIADQSRPEVVPSAPAPAVLSPDTGRTADDKIGDAGTSARSERVELSDYPLIDVIMNGRRLTGYRYDGAVFPLHNWWNTSEVLSAIPLTGELPAGLAASIRNYEEHLRNWKIRYWIGLTAGVILPLAGVSVIASDATPEDKKIIGTVIAGSGVAGFIVGMRAVGKISTEQKRIVNAYNNWAIMPED